MSTVVPCKPITSVCDEFNWFFQKFLFGLQLGSLACFILPRKKVEKKAEDIGEQRLSHGKAVDREDLETSGRPTGTSPGPSSIRDCETLWALVAAQMCKSEGKVLCST